MSQINLGYVLVMSLLITIFGVNSSAFAQYSSACGGSADHACDCTDRYVCDHGNCSCQGDQHCAEVCSSANAIQKPTAEQVLLYSAAVNRTPSVDQKSAVIALQKWMDGTLSMKEAIQYNNQLKLNMGPRAEAVITPKSGLKIMSNDSAACLACIAGCCYWFGCNPACEAACAVGACK